jgi:hypothetical protein
MEQAAILALKPVPGLVAMIDAVAGSGKTTTVEMYANEYPQQRFLYLCFNKGQADEAKARFPSNVDCKTTHSLAFGQTGYPYTKNKAKGFGREPRSKAIMGPLGIRDVGTAHAIVRTVTNYMQSAQLDIEYDHLPRYSRSFELETQKGILGKAGELWRKMIDANDIEIPISHDAYLKLFQLTALRANRLPAVFSKYDAVLIDEAQDTNPTFEILLAMLVNEGRHAAVLVGDRRQSIYQWRGAVNMMGRLGNSIRRGTIPGQVLRLTESFRYRPRTAGFAVGILSLDSESPVRIIGRGTDNPNTQGDHCYLARTNAGLVAEVLPVLQSDPGAIVHFAATKEPDWSPRIAYKFDFLRSVFGHFANQPYLITDPEVRRFVSWSDILEHAKRGDGQDGEAVDQELATAVAFVAQHQHQTPGILDLIESHSGAPDDAIATFSTAHRAKGLEWDRITLLEDFPHLADDDDEEEEWRVPDEQELNLLYVAVTRGRHWVELNSDLESFFTE